MLIVFNFTIEPSSLVKHIKDFYLIADKIDQSNKTGAQGGTESKLGDTGKLVIEMIGKESPVVQGIGVPDSIETVFEVKEITEDFVSLCPMKTMIMAPQKSSARFNKVHVEKRVIVQQPDDDKNIQSLKIKKLQLEVRKLELEVWEKECSLNVKHFVHTMNIEFSNYISGYDCKLY
ncbi:unnamed protein product [Psylliodes chrysocephalus]|uniref:Uncharacterized protein n=1 Tax=Psylliodes chrysocephalus TaxID=3402493 RepID=A0A9P0GEY8_9CUCU|nr:unnamed protein product [Psylliodes chrysocephala]